MILPFTRGQEPIDQRIKVRTGPEPLDVAEAIAFVAAPESGGTAVFVGTVRSPNEGETVDHLFYELWDEKVVGRLENIAGRALDEHAATSAYVAHRSGRVEVGDASVVVCVSAPHRDEAFAACRFLIDTLKASAPIWKQEVTRSGERWVGVRE